MGKKVSGEDETERAKRIAELKRQAEELTGGEMVVGEMEETSPEVAEQFWEQVVAYEKAHHFQAARRIRYAVAGA